MALRGKTSWPGQGIDISGSPLKCLKFERNLSGLSPTPGRNATGNVINCEEIKTKWFLFRLQKLQRLGNVRIAGQPLIGLQQLAFSILKIA